jgi:NAD(P)-dependent dehydrogenase (short-subunit alcohol dehydrogenase family)
MSISNFKNKQVLITGGAAGIGYETALAFARCGAHVMLVDLNPSGLEKAAAEIAKLGVECRTWVVNVSDEAAMTGLANEVTSAIGVPDVLVNNAGIGFLGPFVETPMSAWRRVMDVNLMGVVHGCALFVPRMLEAGGPRCVVNVASAAALGPVGGLSAYTASKHAVVGFSETLAIELAGTQVGLTVVCPGLINTAIVRIGADNSTPSVKQAQADRIVRYYEEHGCHPKVVAGQIVAAVQAGKGLITPGPTATMAHYARKLLPRNLLLKLSADAARKVGYLS